MAVTINTLWMACVLFFLPLQLLFYVFRWVRFSITYVTIVLRNVDEIFSERLLDSALKISYDAFLWHVFKQSFKTRVLENSFIHYGITFILNNWSKGTLKFRSALIIWAFIAWQKILDTLLTLGYQYFSFVCLSIIWTMEKYEFHCSSLFASFKFFVFENVKAGFVSVFIFLKRK